DAAECIVADRVTEPPFPVRFTVGYGDAKFLDFLEDWTLKDNKFCQGETACDVFISPSFSGQNSTVLITAKASCTKLHQQQLFLCPKTGTPRLSTPCIVLGLAGKPWRLRHLIASFISPTRMQRMDFEDNIM
ncbi:unnamed protein product, partial [Durusdinium trenchii]